MLRKPVYLIMLIPVYVQKLFHDNYGMWSISGQYVIEFAPILAIGTFSVLGQANNSAFIPSFCRRTWYIFKNN